MKAQKYPIIVAVLSFLFIASFSVAWAQGTAFTYQGRLETNGTEANGNYDFQFRLFGTNESGTALTPDLTNSDVSVSDGLFTTSLDFGTEPLLGTNVWLDIAVRSHGSPGAFTELTPRQLLTATPFAVTAANLAGVVENNFVQTGATNTTISGGTENAIAATGATIGGGQANVIGSNSVIAVISGGANNSVGVNDDTSTIAGGNGNIIQNGAGVSTIGGGVENIISTGAPRSVIAGGSNNTIGTNSEHSVIGGGGGNQITLNSYYSVIGGGNGNEITASSTLGTIGGGFFNTIGTNSNAATIGGGGSNTIGTNDNDATISGGVENVIFSGAYNGTISGGNDNKIASYGTTIAGGLQNTAGTESAYSSIGGGELNGIQDNAFYSVVAGGFENQIGLNANSSVIGGGANNAIGTNASGSVVGGGNQNQIDTGNNMLIAGGFDNTLLSGMDSAILGGSANSMIGTNSVIVGGYANQIVGNYSFAAGSYAGATSDGSFVWADASQANYFTSTGNNQFLVRASGGVGINTANPAGASLYVQGSQNGGSFANATAIFENTSGATGAQGSGPALRVVGDGGSGPAGALSVSANGTGPIAEFGNGLQFVASVENDGTIKSKGVALTSDRNVKEHFAPLDTERVLEKVAGLPVTEWNYKTDAAGVKHIGPVAQDFSATFGLNGEDDKHISVVDEGGVALAAIQGLNAKLEAEVQDLRSQNGKLERRLADIEAMMKRRN